MIHRGEKPITGAAEAVSDLRRLGLKLLFLTNNGTKPSADVRERLAGFGVDAAEDEILTAATVAAEEIVQRGLTSKSTYVVGLGGIRTELERVGVTILEGDEGKNAELVVVSGDFEFTYEKMHIASSAVRAGAIFLATNSDPTFPTPEGLRPGAGALVAAIETAGGRRAEVTGKPHLPMMEAAARRLDGSKHIGIVGDQPGTDLAGGQAMGWKTILVLSGVTSAEEVDDLSPPPDLVLGSIAELTDKIELAR
ncbi:MAG: HAD-IIA family hydrolase [Actinobacteria bacterium]|nr:HAD-IIA family hydrolase [Actinomycetota bacterium]